MSAEELWEKELASRHDARLIQQRAHETTWRKGVEPYLRRKQASGPFLSNIERQLDRFRKEDSNLEKKMTVKRQAWDRTGRKLLKDVNFLFEKHKERVNDTRVGDMQPNADGSETPVARKQRELRAVEKSIEELKAGEITESKLRMIEGVHKTMLKDLFNSEDEDGGGVRKFTSNLPLRVRSSCLS